MSRSLITLFTVFSLWLLGVQNVAIAQMGYEGCKAEASCTPHFGGFGWGEDLEEGLLVMNALLHLPLSLSPAMGLLANPNDDNALWPIYGLVGGGLMMALDIGILTGFAGKDKGYTIAYSSLLAFDFAVVGYSLYRLVRPKNEKNQSPGLESVGFTPTKDGAFVSLGFSF